MAACGVAPQTRGVIYYLNQMLFFLSSSFSVFQIKTMQTMLRFLAFSAIVATALAQTTTISNAGQVNWANTLAWSSGTPTQSVNAAISNTQEVDVNLAAYANALTYALTLFFAAFCIHIFLISRVVLVCVRSVTSSSIYATAALAVNSLTMSAANITMSAFGSVTAAAAVGASATVSGQSSISGGSFKCIAAGGGVRCVNSCLCLLVFFSIVRSFLCSCCRA